MNNIYNLFYPLTEKYTLQQIANFLEIHIGTVKRWCEKKEVPSSYYFDLAKLSKVEIDYSKFSYKEKDQFYTNKETSSYCIEKTKTILNSLNENLDNYTWIEPSSGNGSFYKLLPENKIGLDIEPRCKNIINQDFLTWMPSTDKNICIGNPPFGLRGNLALKFINHAAKFSDYVCFILPQLFDSNGKGSCKSRVKDLNLIHSEIISPKFYYPDETEVSVNVVFQIWSKHNKIEEDIVDLSNKLKIYSLSDGGTPSSTRNKKHLYCCDYYLPSTCFGESNMKLYNEFEELPHRRGYGIVILDDKNNIKKIIETISWKDVAFQSTNSALNLRFDIIEKSIWNMMRQFPNRHRGTP